MRLCVNILLLLSLRVSFAQQVSSDSSFQCSLKTGITRLDFFSGLEGVYCDEHLVFLSSFELGVNRTFFQQHIFPRASVGFGYRFVIGPMQFDPLMMFSQSILKLSTSDNSRHYWTECYMGYRFAIGKKWKFVNEIMCGWMSERYLVNTSGAKKTFGTFGYYGSLGLARNIR